MNFTNRVLDPPPTTEELLLRMTMFVKTLLDAGLSLKILKQQQLCQLLKSWEL